MVSCKPSPMLSSLPEELRLEILARVPKRRYPFLSLVSKEFHRLLRPSLINTWRRRIGTDSVYLCFATGNNGRAWRALQNHDDKNGENCLVSADFDIPLAPDMRWLVITYGVDVIFILFSRRVKPIFRIFDSRNKVFRLIPVMQDEQLMLISAGLVGEKLYVVGNSGPRIRAESFDLKTQTWDSAPPFVVFDKKTNDGAAPTFIDRMRCFDRWFIYPDAIASADKKVYGLRLHNPVYYDTRDGSWDRFELPNQKQLCSTGVCVINNVLYVYDSGLGLMWYDSALLRWRMVLGLHLPTALNRVVTNLNLHEAPLVNAHCFGLADFYGKLAFLWIEESGDVKNIWCTLIQLRMTGSEINGTAEPFHSLGTVPSRFELEKCFSVVR
ncbi:hypothetical protein CARUB_v10019337mg [Capsella rubella]|uniref:F-box domain-containing protein n=1 Tax=Capsella rubella TaxID=81985 RepID=R0HPT9_9BRAS|nr:F-box/kelch-repeat protein At2g44630 [Capsella rubella]EOA25948.1 hypothetical protein CARUB_v10019337mg [Capsella rubella]